VRQEHLQVPPAETLALLTYSCNPGRFYTPAAASVAASVAASIAASIAAPIAAPIAASATASSSFYGCQSDPRHLCSSSKLLIFLSLIISFLIASCLINDFNSLA
jgi:hypothetical protein